MQLTIWGTFLQHLAQKLGLIAAPEQPLSENDWQKVKETSNKRDDFKQPCVICKEDFGVKEQVCHLTEQH